MTSSSEVVNAVKDKIRTIEPSLPKGVTIDPFYDRTDLVRRTIATVEKNLLEGGLLVIAVLFLMLGSLRGGLIVAAAIPLPMLVAFIGMLRCGVSGNLMSLGAIDFGLIVDGSVVMIENVFRLMSEKRMQGKAPGDIVREATVEVARPVAFAVGIIMIVYLPILTLTGIEGKMFKPMAVTVMFALAGSLVLALTVVPVLAALFLRKAPKHHETWVVRQMKRAYAPALASAMRHRLIVVGIAVAVFAAGAGVASFMGGEFIPKLDEGAIALQVWRLPSVSVEEAAKQSELIENALRREFPREVETVVSKTGRGEIATDPMGVEMSDVFVMLKPHRGWRFGSKELLLEAMEKTLRRAAPGVALGFSQPIELRVAELVSGVRSDVAIKLFGADLDVLRGQANEIARAVAGVPGAQDVKVEQVSGLPIMTAKIDREAIARHGATADEVLSVIEALGGRQVGVILDGEKRFALRVRFPPEARTDAEGIARIPVSTSGGRLVPLGELVDLDMELSAAQISRENIKRRITVEMNVRGRDIASFVEQAKAALASKVHLPAGYTVAWGGQFENLERASKRLGVVVPLTLLLIFVLLYGTFGAVRPALLIFLNVPFAATGGVFALALRGMPFSISAGVGFIALFGVAVMNGVVLVNGAGARAIAACAALLWLGAGCSSNDAPKHSRPVANAGPDQATLVGQPVKLDGTGTTNTDGHQVRYQWTLGVPAGSAAALDDPSSATPGFTPDRAGAYTVKLAASDDKMESNLDTVMVDAVAEGHASGSVSTPSVEMTQVAERLNAVLALGYNTTTADVLAKQLFGKDTRPADGVLVLDTREPADFAAGHVPGSVNVPLQQLPAALLARPSIIPPAAGTGAKDIVVASYSGGDGNMATLLLNVARIADPVAQKTATADPAKPPLPFKTAKGLMMGMTSWTYKLEVSLRPGGGNYRFTGDTNARETSTAAVPGTDQGKYPAWGAFAASRDLVSKILLRAADYLDSVPSQHDLQVDGTQLAAMMTDPATKATLQILSVRKGTDYATGHIPGALNIVWQNVGDLTAVKVIDSEKPLVVYCYTGHTGAEATMALGILGYPARNLLYGMNGWNVAKSGAPLSRFDLMKGWDFPLASPAVTTLAGLEPRKTGCVGCHTDLTSIQYDLWVKPPPAGTAPESVGEG